MGKLYKKELITKNKICFPLDITWAEDVIFNLEYLEHTKNALVIPSIGYYYRQSEQSVTYKFNQNALAECYNMFCVMKNILNRQNTPDMKDSFALFVIRHFLYRAQNSLYHKKNSKKYLERRKEIVFWRNKPILNEALKVAKIKNYKKKMIIISAYCLKYKMYFLLDMLYQIKGICNKIKKIKM